MIVSSYNCDEALKLLPSLESSLFVEWTHEEQLKLNSIFLKVMFCCDQSNQSN